MSNNFQDTVLTTLFGMHRQTDSQTHKQPKNIMPPATTLQRHNNNGEILEGARESAYLCQVNFHRPPFQKILRVLVQTVPGNMHVKYEVRSINHFGAIST